MVPDSTAFRETAHPLTPRIHGADHDDRDRRVALGLTKPSSDLEAVHRWQHGVEEKEVWSALLDGLERLLAAARLSNLIAFSL